MNGMRILGYVAFGGVHTIQRVSLHQGPVEVVSAYVSNNPVPVGELASLISKVHSVLTNTAGSVVREASKEPQGPAVPIKKSVTPDYIISLEDGKKFKSLKRHLSASYGLSPDEYRAKWGLPADYPMTAPNYSARRSAMAKTLGLGRKAAPPAPANRKSKNGA